MSIASIVVSGQTVTSSQVYTSHFDFLFDPPSNIRGRSCYLQVKQASMMFAIKPTEDIYGTNYLISTSLYQPHSFNSVNDAYSFQPNPDSNYLPNGPSKVVAMLTGINLLGEAPKILVNIPNGPEKIRISIQAVTDINQFTVDVPPHLTLLMEIVPASIIG